MAYAVTDSSAAPLLASEPARKAAKTAVEILAGPSAYTDLREEWLALAARQRGTTVFQSPDLLTVWAGYFCRRPGTLRTIVVRQGGGPVLIWPTVVTRSGPARILRSPFHPISQYDDLLLDPGCDRPAAIAAARRAIAELRPDLMLFRAVRQDSALLEALGPDARRLCEPEGAPFTETAGGYERVKAQLKSAMVRTQRKRVRKFEESGKVEFAVAENAAQGEAWLAEILAAKRQWLVATGRYSAAFSDPRTPALLRELARRLSCPGNPVRIIVARLSFDGAMAAAEFAFVHQRAYHLYLAAFAPELARFGTGNVMAERMIDWCAQNGIARYDMMAPRTRHKHEWQTGEVEVSDWAEPLTGIGRLYAGLALNIGGRLRERYYTLPEGLRSRIVANRLRI